ncbi:Holliday junction branch migration protein RuvA [Spirulina subsalsa FACHB-351]|uniref:Holliday junction branch migration complex subunit RuvA n=1 Tax=Spirulina subsalsa FACHB-351 TaxID=234711 RepID=A0ABT3LA45_9CYAN|nr:Holliday junction branch migration protein RuvA [Spirulina subsalsa]MCW6038370.1 Holliday junction branch migration protein RuvA [Spirulina subsalsa FACHB-351]
MLAYLKGKAIAIVKSLNGRVLLWLEVQGVGYEIQIPSRWGRHITLETGEEMQVFTHQQVREDAFILYGFESVAERDLFRHLISVSGIGSQLAIALIDTLGIADLVQAIVAGNINTLSKTPGVGKKTAERISLELRTKLAQWREKSGVVLSGNSPLPSPEIQADVEMTLLALGYDNDEIEQAFSVLSGDAQLMKNPAPEEWIRSAIAWLSQ